MVRINLIEPRCLADQHLIAEYNEILMLLGYVRLHPFAEDIPDRFLLGKGHIKFFKNKLLYIQKRHELLKEEMKKRNFVPEKTIDLSEFNEELLNDFIPSEEDFEIIKERIKEKILLKPEFYKYYGKNKPVEFFLDLLE